MQTTPRRSPRVSVAIPVYNGADWIAQTVTSALEQTFEDIEVVVVDNASSDDTPLIVRGLSDDRVRLFENPTNLGPYVNQNRTIQCARGSLIKFLHADDFLLPSCVEKMVSALDAHPGAGMVFSRRRIELADTTHPGWQWWREEYGEPHRHFSNFGEINDGRLLLRQFLRANFPDNWIGEPTSVMARRSALNDVGGFSLHVRQFNDIELWTRIMGRYQVAFVDEELAVARIGSGVSLTSTNRTAWRNWLDRLWLLESLRTQPGLPSAVPEIAERLTPERRAVVRMLLKTMYQDPGLFPEKLRDYGRYLYFRAAEGAGRPQSLHPEVRAGTSGMFAV